MGYKFTYKSKYGTYNNCSLVTSRYSENSNLYIEIVSPSQGPIIGVTVNTGVRLSDDYLAVKNYGENEGMDIFLKSEGIIVDQPIRHIESGYVVIPIYRITEKGKEVLGLN